jgi:hypothetical protein
MERPTWWVEGCERQGIKREGAKGASSSRCGRATTRCAGPTDRSGSTSVSAALGVSIGNSPPLTWLTSASPALGVARPRLGELYGLAVVDRLRPRADMGSAPSHWVLGSVAAALVAAERGVKTVDLDRRKGMLSDLAASQRLAHLVGTNSVPASPHPLRPSPPGLPARGVVVGAALCQGVGRDRPPRRLRHLDRPRPQPATPDAGDPQRRGLHPRSERGRD